MGAATWLRGLAAFNVVGNPIGVQHRRARLRRRHLLSWGLITLTLTTFICVLVYSSAKQRGEVEPAVAAKAILAPLVVMQGVILMGLGTSAVATGIARERDQQLLDYHRLTPMSPAAKILGYLYGLPAREYALFAITLPFVAFAVVKGGVPWLKVAHFYTVFFSSVWVYHLTGLMVGMVSKKPWQSSLISLGTVAGLYLVLPQFAQVGLSFFDFLTFRPTFYGMVYEEISAYGVPDGSLEAFYVRRYESVPFFGLRLNPTAFSLLIQGAALVTMYHVARRKLIDQHWHPFSKRFSVVFVVAMNVLLVGNLWPVVRDEVLLERLLARLGGEGRPFLIGVLVGVFVAISGAAAMLAVHLVTPHEHTARRGLRRARRLGLDAVPWSWDAATSRPLLWAMLATAWLGYLGFVFAAVSGGLVFPHGVPWVWLLVIAALGTLVAISFQALNEWLGTRPFVMVLFFLWVVPLMVMVVLLASRGDEVAATYAAVPSPFSAGVLTLWSLIDGQRDLDPEQTSYFRFIRAGLKPHALAAIAATVVFYFLLASFATAGRRRTLQRRRVAEDAAALPGEPDVDAPGETQQQADHAVDGEERRVQVPPGRAPDQGVFHDEQHNGEPDGHGEGVPELRAADPSRDEAAEAQDMQPPADPQRRPDAQ